jgi:hypothetical protein
VLGWVAEKLDGIFLDVCERSQKRMVTTCLVLLMGGPRRTARAAVAELDAASAKDRFLVLEWAEVLQSPCPWRLQSQLQLQLQLQLAWRSRLVSV